MANNTTTKHADEYSVEAQLAVVREYNVTWLAIRYALMTLRDEVERHPEDAHRLRESIIAHLETVTPALDAMNAPVERLRFWYLDKYHAELEDAREAELAGGADEAR